MQKKTVIEAKPFCLVDNEGFEVLDKGGVSYTDIRGRALDDPEVKAALSEATTLICGNQLEVDGAFIDAFMPRLEVIGKVGAGVDNIKIPDATARGIMVFNTPGANSQAVADLALGLIIAVCRKIPTGHRIATEGKELEDYDSFGIDLWGKTLGLLGLGAIGKNVALRAKGFNMDIVAYDPYWPAEFAEAQGIRRAENYDEVFKVADFLSLHLPHTPETENIVNKNTLALMTPKSIVINTARGGLVNEQDLAAAVKSGQIGGAGLDAHRHEPLEPDYPMFGLDNVVLMPHVGGFSYGAINNMSVWTAEQIVDYYNGIKPRFLLNPDYINHCAKESAVC